MALFGEKYGDEVRVVSMGKDKDKIFSLELCGGTHVSKTGEIGNFAVINESSIASGIRRIEALRGNELKDYINKKNIEKDSKTKDLKQKLKNLVDDIKQLGGDFSQFENFLDEKQINAASNYLNSLKISQILSNKESNIKNIIIKGDLKIFTQIFIGLPSKAIRDQIDTAKKEQNAEVVMVVSKDNSKTSIGVGISNSNKDKFDASKIVKDLSSFLGGQGGGGRKDFAQAGGKDATVKEIKEAFNKAIDKFI